MNPITEIETVYTCSMYFKQIASRLKQSVLLVFCDEEVYHLVIKIQLEHPRFSTTYLLCLAAFTRLRLH